MYNVPSHNQEMSEDKKGIKVWNDQIAGYAGYELDDGKVLGDPNNVKMTKFAIEKMGWKPPSTLSQFDLLPLVLSGTDGVPKLYNISSGTIPEVKITHPTLTWFEDLGLKWCAVPGICYMGLDIGTKYYQTAPVSGWFMLTEVTRNLADESRYNVLPLIAKKLGLDVDKPRSLWKDRALVELNDALLFSYNEAKV
jgi:nitric-oxide synthase